MLNEWQNWCRLCAKENGNDINVLVKDENIRNLSEQIQKFFSIEVIANDDYSSSICLDCHKFISEIVIFTERTSRVQSMYSEFKFSSDIGTVCVDLTALRNQFGISSNNAIKLISQSTDTTDLTNSLYDQDITSKRKTAENELDIFNDEKCNIINFKNITDDNNEENMTEIDYLNEDLLEIKYEQQDNDEQNSEDDNLGIYKRKISTRRKSKLSENNEIADSKYVCEICYKVFKRQRSYSYHMKLNHNKINTEILFECDKCNKKFKTKRRLTNHIETHLPPVPDEKLLYPCPICDQQFSKKYLYSHARAVHKNAKPYICEECGKAFSSSGALKEHKYTHIDDTPYQCPKCSKKFKNKARLKTHTDTHNDTMYVCTTCGLQLNTRRTLLMHMVVHSDQKKHKCNFCGNEYKRAKALKNHLILHTGLRPYSCPFCEKTFANGSNCRSHKKKAHPNELAALEASGEKPNITNIPKLEQLKSVSLGEISQIAKTEIWNNDIMKTDLNDQQICNYIELI